MKLFHSKSMSYITILSVVFFISFNHSSLASEKKTLLGNWKLNVEETERLRPKLPKARTTQSGFGSNLRVGVAGVPVPTPGGGTGARGQSANMPRVLSCNTLNLSQVSEEIHMLCDDDVKARKFKIGKHHGRTARWKTKTLTEAYTSTSRRVKHEFSIKNGRMHVEVMVKPQKSSRLRYLVVFDRQSDSLNSES